MPSTNLLSQRVFVKSKKTCENYAVFIIIATRNRKGELVMMQERFPESQYAEIIPGDLRSAAASTYYNTKGESVDNNFGSENPLEIERIGS